MAILSKLIGRKFRNKTACPRAKRLRSNLLCHLKPTRLALEPLEERQLLSTTLYWDPDGDPTNNNIQTGEGLGGDGIWTTEALADHHDSKVWYDPATGQDVVWDNVENDIAVFMGTAGTVTLSTASAGAVRFDTAGYTLASSSESSSLTLCPTGDTVNAIVANQSVTINSSIGMANDQTWLVISGELTVSGELDLSRNHKLIVDVDDGASSTISGRIWNDGGLTKTGTGTLTLTGGNEYLGMTINEGTLVINADKALGQASGGLTFSGNGTLQTASSMTLQSARGITIDADVTATLDLQAYNVTIAGVIAGGGSLAKMGTGTLTLTGANTYGGDTAIKDGMLALDGYDSSTPPEPLANRLPTGTVVTFGTTTTNGTLNLNGHNQQVGGLAVASGATAASQVIGNDSTAANATLTVNSADNSTFGGTIQDELTEEGTHTTAITKAGTGILTLSGANTYSGRTTIDGGNLQFDSSYALSDNTDILINSGGALNAIGAFSSVDEWLEQTKAPILHNPLGLDSTGAIALTSANTDTSITMTDYRLCLGVLGDVTYAGELVPDGTTYRLGGGTGTLTVTTVLANGGEARSLYVGGGNVILDPASDNTYSGGTTIDGGHLQFNTHGRPSTGSIVINENGALNAIGVHSSVSDWLTYGNVDTDSTGTIALTSSNTDADITMTGYGSLRLGALGDVTYGGTLTPAGTTYRLGGGSGTLTVTTVLTNAGATLRSLYVHGGNVVLAPQGDNTYTGGTTIDGIIVNGDTIVAPGTLVVGSDTYALPLAGNVAVNAGGTLDLNSHTVTIHALTGSGEGIVTDTSTSTEAGTTFVIVSQQGNEAFDGQFVDGPVRKVAPTRTVGKNFYFAEDGRDPGGENGGDGTINNPWRTLRPIIYYASGGNSLHVWSPEKGIPANSILPGDTVYFREGTYDVFENTASLVTNDAASLWIKISGAEDHPITFKAYPGETVVWNTCFQLGGDTGPFAGSSNEWKPVEDMPGFYYSDAIVNIASNSELLRTLFQKSNDLTVGASVEDSFRAVTIYQSATCEGHGATSPKGDCTGLFTREFDIGENDLDERILYHGKPYYGLRYRQSGTSTPTYYLFYSGGYWYISPILGDTTSGGWRLDVLNSLTPASLTAYEPYGKDYKGSPKITKVDDAASYALPADFLSPPNQESDSGQVVDFYNEGSLAYDLFYYDLATRRLYFRSNDVAPVDPNVSVYVGSISTRLKVETHYNTIPPHDLTFDGITFGVGMDLTLGNVSNIVIRNCEFKGSSICSYSNCNVDNTTVENCYFDWISSGNFWVACTSDNVYGINDRSHAIEFDGNNNIIRNNFFGRSLAGPYVHFYYGRSNGLQLYNNVLYSYSSALTVGGDDIDIFNNVFLCEPAHFRGETFSLSNIAFDCGFYVGGDGEAFYQNFVESTIGELFMAGNHNLWGPVENLAIYDNVFVSTTPYRLMDIRPCISGASHVFFSSVSDNTWIAPEDTSARVDGYDIVGDNPLQPYAMSVQSFVGQLNAIESWSGNQYEVNEAGGVNQTDAEALLNGSSTLASLMAFFRKYAAQRSVTVRLNSTIVPDDSILTATVSNVDLGDVSVPLTFTYKLKVNDVEIEAARISNTPFKTVTFDLSSYSIALGDTVTVEVTSRASGDPTDSAAVSDSATVWSANTHIWTGAGEDNLWTNAANWVNNEGDAEAPTTNDYLVFAGTSGLETVNDFTAGTVFAGIAFASSGFSVSGNSFTLADGATIDSDAYSATISADILLGGDVVVDAASECSVTLSGVVSDGVSSYSLTKGSGLGTVILSSHNTYDGGTIVTGGTLAYGANDVLSDTASLQVAGGTLDLGAYSDTVGAVTVTDGTIDGTGTLASDISFTVASSIGSKIYAVLAGSAGLTVSTGHATRLYGQNTFSGGTTINSGVWLYLGDGGTLGSGVVHNNGRVFFDYDNEFTFENVIEGSGGITKEHGGTLILTGANTYTGGTNVYSGTLCVSSISALGNPNSNSPSYVSSLATLQYTGTGNDTLIGTFGTVAGTIDVTQATGSLTLISGNGIVDSASLVKSGAGTLTLAGNITGSGKSIVVEDGKLILSGSNSYTGTTTINGGVLQFDSGAWSSGTSIIINENGTLNATGAYSSVNDWLTYGNINTASSGTIALTSTNADSAIAMGNYSSLRLGAFGDVIYGGTLTPATGTTVYRLGGGTGTLTIEANLGDGDDGATPLGLSVLGGSVVLTPATGNTYSGVTTVEKGTLIATAPTALSTTSSVEISSGATVAVTAANWTSADVTALLAKSTFASGANFGMNVASGLTDTYSAAIEGSFHFVKIGAGALILSGTNTYSGGTTVGEGTLSVASISNNLGSSTSAIILGDDTHKGTLHYTGGTATYSYGFTVGAGGGQIDIVSDITLTIDGAGIEISDGVGLTFNGRARVSSVISGEGGVTKTWPSRSLTLLAANTYSGGTALVEGVIYLGGTLGDSTGDVVMSSGTSLIFSPSTDMTVNNNISGSGTVVHTGSGVVTLGGNNTYTGSTTINGANAVFSVDSLGRLGAGAISFGVNGGTIRYTGAGAESIGRAMSAYLGPCTFDITEPTGSLVFSPRVNTINKNVTKNGPGSLTLSRVISGDASVTVNAGMLILSGANTYSGDTIINGGVLQFDSGAWSSGTGIIINENGALNATGAYSSVNDWLTHGNIATASSGTIALTSANGDSAIAMNGYSSLRLGAYGDVTYGGALTPATGTTIYRLGGGTGTLTLTMNLGDDGATPRGLYIGGGSVALAPAIANTYSGVTTIHGGVLNINSDAVLGATSSIVFTGSGTLQAGAGSVSITSSRAITINDGVTATFDTQANSMSVAGVIANAPGGVGALKKIGTGTLTLSGANTYNGGTSIDAGTLNINSNNALGAATGALTFAGSGTLQAGADAISLTYGTTARGIVINQNVTATIDNNGHAMTVPGVITGAGNFVKTGSGNLALWANNDYAGTTTIEQAEVILGAYEPTGSLGEGQITINSGAWLRLRRSGDYAINNVIAGIGGTLIKESSGTLTLGGANTFTGGTSIWGGAIRVQSIADSGRSNLGYAVWLRIGRGCTLCYTGSSDASTSRDLVYTGNYTGGTIQVDNPDMTLSLTSAAATAENIIKTGAGTLSIACPIEDPESGSASVTVNGGTLILSGTNTYTGVTTVNGGTLVVNGTLSSSSTATVTVADGAALAGTGTIDRPVTLQSGAILSPGGNGGDGVGTLTVGYSGGTGVLFASGSTFRVDINGNTAGEYDKLIVNGTVALGGSTLSLVGSYEFVNGVSLTILENDGSDVDGTFANSTIEFNGLTLTINCAGGDGNDVVLSYFNLQAASYGEAARTAPSLTMADLQPIIAEAIARWAAAGLDAATVARLSQVQFVIADLDGCSLGKVQDDQIYLDIDAAGYGWFVDATPTSDEEYELSEDSGETQAIDPRAVDRIDLLTVVEHELGHIAGFDDLDAAADSVMAGILSAGVRRYG